ncbi:hypothetical protein PMAYCL1PPCAC_03989, partial [Pristionchus mayeri]
QIQWRPELLNSSEISKNQDNLYVEIQMSLWTDNDGIECPYGYLLVKSADNQYWCYIMYWPILPAIGFTFSEAEARCNSSGDYLPIVTSDEINTSLADFVSMHMGLGDIWLGLFCDTETDMFVWQDGEQMQYNAFLPTYPHNCADSRNDYNIAMEYNYDYNTNVWVGYNSSKESHMCVCARRPQSDITITSTHADEKGSNTLPIWAIIAIVVSILLFIVCLIGTIIMARIRIQSLRAEVVEGTTKLIIY